MDANSQGPRSASAAVLAKSNDRSLQQAFDDELGRMEHAVARAVMFMTAGGLVLTLYVAIFVAPRLGLFLTGYGLVTLGWFAMASFCLHRGVGLRMFRWVNPFAEISIPTGIIVIDVLTQGGLYAASSAVPLQIYSMLTAATVLRLRPILPLLVSVVAAVEYALVYLLLMHPQLPMGAASNPALRIDMMLMRSVAMVLGGGMATLACTVLWRTLGKASRGWRSRQLFGKYRLGEMLASGGMGTVYQATYCPEGGFQRPVALKRIHPHLVEHERFVSAFRNEAEIGSRLTHPNIVQVLDFGRIDNTYFLAMEFIDGMTLRQAFNACVALKVKPPARLVALLGREICRGLWFAHDGARDVDGARMRVVHRDLNPPNVLLSRTGQVKITDFGIARAMGEVRQYLTGRLEGKIGYMAPEQAREEPTDERCDLFATGVILWETLCCERLFGAESEIATLLALVEKKVPSTGDYRKDLHVELWDRFFERAICRDLGGRFRSAEEMSDSLTNILEIEGLPGPDELSDFLATLPFTEKGSAAVTTSESATTAVSGDAATTRMA
jgi:eukaryotic-like serine/threonine-protein kinase